MVIFCPLQSIALTSGTLQTKHIGRGQVVVYAAVSSFVLIPAVLNISALDYWRTVRSTLELWMIPRGQILGFGQKPCTWTSHPALSNGFGHHRRAYKVGQRAECIFFVDYHPSSVQLHPYLEIQKQKEIRQGFFKNTNTSELCYNSKILKKIQLHLQCFAVRYLAKNFIPH